MPTRMVARSETCCLPGTTRRPRPPMIAPKSSAVNKPPISTVYPLRRWCLLLQSPPGEPGANQVFP